MKILLIFSNKCLVRTDYLENDGTQMYFTPDLDKIQLSSCLEQVHKRIDNCDEKLEKFCFAYDDKFGNKYNTVFVKILDRYKETDTFRNEHFNVI